MVSNRHGSIHFHAFIKEPSIFNLKILILPLMINDAPYLNSFKNLKGIFKGRLHNLRNLSEKYL